MTDRYETIVNKVAQTLVKAGSCFSTDKYQAYEKYLGKEESELSCWAMEQIVANARTAENDHSPLCDDTSWD